MATTTGAGAVAATKAARAATRHLPLTLTIGLAGWLLIYSGVKGEAPWDILQSVFKGKPLPGRLKASPVTKTVGGAISDVGKTVAGLSILWRTTGHYDHLHASIYDRKVMLKVGRELQAKGYTVRGSTLFPPVGKHTAGSDHYPPCDCAIDVNWYPASDEPEKLDEAERYIRKRVAELTKSPKG